MRDFEKVMLFAMGVIVGLLIIIIIILVNQTSLTVNNYVDAGNYSFDVGDNFVKIINMSQRVN
jgi:cell division protein FtsL